MQQIHKRLTTDQVKTILQGYCAGTIPLYNALELLGVKRRRFFHILKGYRQSPETFKIEYQRQTSSRIKESWEKKITKALKKQQELIDNPKIQLTNHNYSYIWDRLLFQKVYVSKSTIISRAKGAGFYRPQRKKQTVHDREVITTAIGALIQHDASNHLWSPYAAEGDSYGSI
jgi:hypothetical protein